MALKDDSHFDDASRYFADHDRDRHWAEAQKVWERVEGRARTRLETELAGLKEKATW